VDEQSIRFWIFPKHTEGDVGGRVLREFDLIHRFGYAQASDTGYLKACRLEIALQSLIDPLLVSSGDNNSLGL